MRARFFLIVTSIALLAACGREPEEAALAPSILGPKVFQARCAICHGPSGQGLPGLCPPQAGSPIVLGNARTVARIALFGLHGKITILGKEFDGQMPAWNSLSDAELSSVLTYIRGQWGNQAPPISAQQMRDWRAAEGARTQPWTLEELQKLEAEGK